MKATAEEHKQKILRHTNNNKNRNNINSNKVVKIMYISAPQINTTNRYQQTNDIICKNSRYLLS